MSNETSDEVSKCNDPQHSEPFACYRKAEGGFLCADTYVLEHLEEKLVSKVLVYRSYPDDSEFSAQKKIYEEVLDMIRKLREKTDQTDLQCGPHCSCGCGAHTGCFIYGDGV